MEWHVAALISLTVFSFQYFLYKVAAEKKYNSEIITFALMATGAVMAAVCFAFIRPQVQDWTKLTLLAVLGSTTFLFATLFRLNSLKHIPSSIAFFIFDLKLIGIAFVSILFFKDLVTPLQLLGLVTALGAGYLVTKKQAGEDSGYKNFGTGILFALGVVAALTLNSFAIKQASIDYDPFAYMLVSYVCNVISAGLVFFYQKRKARPLNESGSLKMGIAVGALAFLGFFFEFHAIRGGALAVVNAIVSFSTLGAIALSAMVYREKIGLTRGLGLALGFLALFLLR